MRKWWIYSMALWVTATMAGASLPQQHEEDRPWRRRRDRSSATAIG